MNAFDPAMFAGSAFWQPAGEAMLEFLVSGSAVALVFMLIRRVISRLPATFRYAVASMALAALVGLAGYHACENWPVSPSPGAAVTSGPTSSVPSEPIAVSPLAAPAPASAASAAEASPPPVSQFTWDSMRPRLILALPAMWLVGAPLTALLVGLGWTGAARLRRQSTPLVDETLLARFARCQALMQVKGVGLAVCERIAAPIVVGIVKPMILLPPALLTSLTCEQWEMILLHELAHVRRLDNLVNLLQRAVETVLFFHPAIWWASRWMRLEREHCCDAVVLRLGTSPQSYAETLAVLALPGIAPQLATAAMANHELLTRMRHILGTEDLPMTISWKKLGLAAVMFAVVGGLVASDWASSSHQAAADENRQKQLEETILRRVLIDLGAEGPEVVDYVRTRQRGDREEILQAVIEQIERLKAESEAESSSMGGGGEHFAFADRLVERVQRLKAGEQAASRSRYRTTFNVASSRSNWSPDQMLGPPDVKEHGDDPKAWAARNPDQGEEWVRLGYERPIKAAAILIYESFNPGAVTSVGVAPQKDWAHAIVWQATKESRASGSKNVLAIPIKNPDGMAITSVNIHLDERRTAGWSEIDAVGLVDAETGETHWAKTAEASSTYASIYDEASLAKTVVQDQRAAWSADQAIGPPDSKSGADDILAWAAKEADKREEWLHVEFGGEYEPAGILIHESFNPGAIKAVELHGSNGKDSSQIVGSSRKADGSAVTLVQPEKKSLIHAVRILIDEPKVPGWNEIDAVGLIDASTGQVHWATKAKASSSFAEVGPPQDVLILNNSAITQTSEVPSWHPRQATGAPNVPEAGDDGRAWASSTQDTQQEWLELTYDPPVEANLLLVYESFNPGSLAEVQIAPPAEGVEVPSKDPNQASDRGFKSIWKGGPVALDEAPGFSVDGSPGSPPVGPNGIRVATISVPAGAGKIGRVRLLLSSHIVGGWNEIDAVGLLNARTGQVQWASDAKASSWFGEHSAVGVISEGGFLDVNVRTHLARPQFINVPIEMPLGVTVNGGEWESSGPGWHPSHATGAPNVKEGGDNPNAWGSATPDGQKEWLELTYDPPVDATSLMIYQSANPGAITDIRIPIDPVPLPKEVAEKVPAEMHSTLQGARSTYLPLVSNKPVSRTHNGIEILTLPLRATDMPIRRVKLFIDSAKFAGRNQIDAVGLLSTTGEMHWAKEAKASSWFDEAGATAAVKDANESDAGSDKTIFGGVVMRDVAEFVISPKADQKPAAVTEGAGELDSAVNVDAANAPSGDSPTVNVAALRALPDAPPTPDNGQALKLGFGESIQFELPITRSQSFVTPLPIKAVRGQSSRAVEVATISLTEVRLTGKALGRASLELVLEDDSKLKVDVRITPPLDPGVHNLTFTFKPGSVVDSLLILDSLPADQILDVRVRGTRKVTRDVMVVESRGTPPIIFQKAVPKEVDVQTIFPVGFKKTRVATQTSKGPASRARLPADVKVQSVQILYRSSPTATMPPAGVVGVVGENPAEVQWADDVQPVPRRTDPQNSSQKI